MAENGNRWWETPGFSKTLQNEATNKSITVQFIQFFNEMWLHRNELKEKCLKNSKIKVRSDRNNKTKRNK